MWIVPRSHSTVLRQETFLVSGRVRETKKLEVEDEKKKKNLFHFGKRVQTIPEKEEGGLPLSLSPCHTHSGGAEWTVSK